MPIINLDTIEANERNIWQKIWGNFKKILEVLNGGIDNSNLSSTFSINASQIEGAIPSDGSVPVKGDLQVDGTINGVDIVELKGLVEQLKANITTWEVHLEEQSISVSVGPASSVSDFVETTIIPPEGYNGTDCIIIPAISYIDISDASITAAIRIRPDIEKNEGQITIRWRYHIHNQDSTSSLSVAGLFTTGVLFYRRGLDV